MVSYELFSFLEKYLCYLIQIQIFLQSHTSKDYLLNCKTISFLWDSRKVVLFEVQLMMASLDYLEYFNAVVYLMWCWFFFFGEG